MTKLDRKLVKTEFSVYLVPGSIFVVETVKAWIAILPLELSNRIKLNPFEAFVNRHNKLIPNLAQGNIE